MVSASHHDHKWVERFGLRKPVNLPAHPDVFAHPTTSSRGLVNLNGSDVAPSKIVMNASIRSHYDAWIALSETNVPLVIDLVAPPVLQQDRKRHKWLTKFRPVQFFAQLLLVIVHDGLTSAHTDTAPPARHQTDPP